MEISAHIHDSTVSVQFAGLDLVVKVFGPLECQNFELSTKRDIFKFTDEINSIVNWAKMSECNIQFAALILTHWSRTENLCSPF